MAWSPSVTMSFFVRRSLLGLGARGIRRVRDRATDRFLLAEPAATVLGELVVFFLRRLRGNRDLPEVFLAELISGALDDRLRLGRIDAGDVESFADVLLRQVAGRLLGPGVIELRDLAVAFLVCADLGADVAREPEDDVEP